MKISRAKHIFPVSGFKDRRPSFIATGETILLTNSEGWHNVQLCDIISCEVEDFHIRFCLWHAEPVLVRNSLSYFEMLLGPFGFMKVHQSYLINLQHLQQIIKLEQGYAVRLTDGKEYPIARQRKVKLLNDLYAQSILKDDPQREGEDPDSMPTGRQSRSVPFS